MQRPFSDLQSQLKKVWGGMSQGQKIVFLMISATLIAGLITVVIYSGRPDFAAIYQQLGPEEAGQVVDKLRELNIPYRISAGGTRIEVPQDQVHAVRMRMAQEGIPPRGTGFELFDRGTFGLTNFLQRVNYQRGLQGELERTIMQLEGVESARVHLVMPEDGLFLDERREPTASVVLRMRPTATLGEPQTEAITSLVANSVEGLNPNRVTIVDDRGNILATGTDEASWTSLSGFSAMQLAMKRDYEDGLTRRIQSMLESVLGYRRAVVRVSADIDFERREGEKEIFEPITGTEGIPRSIQETEERYEGGGQFPGGVPGIGSNIPVYGTEEPPQEHGTYSRRDSTVNFEINRITERFAVSPGRLNRLSVAVLVDDTLLPEDLVRVNEAVRAASGADPARGDVVIVEAVPFNPEIWEEERRALETRRLLEFIELFAKYGILAALLILMFIMGRRILAAATATPEEVFAEFYEDDKEYGEAGEGEEELVPVRLGDLSREEKMRMELQGHMESEIKKLLQSNPEDGAKLIRNWLVEE
ncbi:MAG TPA: flagellar basal-body MS-ring/collar protein FliF [Atribacteraceae bacterium]|nr:flagellar basal-body MS-ring/collar protein FliF [Atribacteraceae bacterium]